MSASEAISSKMVLCWKGSSEINAIKLRPADYGNLDNRRGGRRSETSAVGCSHHETTVVCY